MIEALKRELQEAIASMGLRVKFELLHDEVPQVGRGGDEGGWLRRPGRSAGNDSSTGPWSRVHLTM
jgi:hypothetical protein